MATANQDSATGAQERAQSGQRGGTSGNDFLAGFTRLDMLRQLGLMLGLAASVALGFAVVLWSQSDEYQPLYGNMEGYDSGELMQVLDEQNIDYRVDTNSGVILVPSERLADIRVQVASSGVSREDGYGYEMLDEDQGLGTSQFMEVNRFRRSLEGELRRTISGLRWVDSARVHLATPERSVFVRNERKPTASVFLTLRSARRPDENQVQGVANLVASGVPEMSPEDVTVVDQQGNLLSGRDQSPEMAMAAEQLGYVRRYEESLVQRISRILEPVIGPGRFTAEVSADVDFTRTEQAAESFNPENRVLRSEQSTREQSAGGSFGGGIPGALSNQPPEDGQAGQQAQAEAEAGGETGEETGEETAPAGNTREQSTRNYEIDRTISYTNHDPTSVQRLSVAVVIDEQSAVDAGMESWSEQDMERITALVRDAVGYSAERGDSVTVVNRRFASLESEPATETPLWQQPWVLSAAKQLGAALFLLALVFGVLMPVLRHLAAGGAQGRQLAHRGSGGDYDDLGMEGMGDESVTLSGGDDTLLPGPTDNYERQLDTVRGLVAQDPGRVAQVVKQWVNNDV